MRSVSNPSVGSSFANAETLTLLSSRKLRPFAAYRCVKALGKRGDKVVDVRITTGFIDLLLCHFFRWFSGAQENVEFDRTSVESLGRFGGIRCQAYYNESR